MEVLAILALIVTFFGFIITIWQIYKTKKTSNAAYLAATEAYSAIKSTMIISDLSEIVKLIQEIKIYIRHRKYDASYLRTNDLIHSLIQVKQLILAIKYDKEELLKKMIIQLSILRSQLETAIYNSNNKIDIIKINQK